MFPGQKNVEKGQPSADRKSLARVIFVFFDRFLRKSFTQEDKIIVL
jgi:hypothetical protein